MLDLPTKRNGVRRCPSWLVEEYDAAVGGVHRNAAPLAAEVAGPVEFSPGTTHSRWWPPRWSRAGLHCPRRSELRTFASLRAQDRRTV